MLIDLIAAVVTLFVNAPPPERLDDPARSLSRLVPEGRVLEAETVRDGDGGPQLVQATLGPVLRAHSFVVIDVASGRVLAAREPSAVRPVASLTKLLTAMTVARSTRLDDIVTIPGEAVAAGRRGADAGLVRGETLRVRDLLAALLVQSANDAAVALAIHASGSEEVFARRMEETATALGLSRTRAENATGFDSLRQFSSASDVARLLSAAWQHAEVGLLLRTEALTIASTDGRFRHRLQTTNRLLGVRSDVLGGKTGLTDAAGENLALMAESPDGHLVAAVVLGSSERFADMENVLNWTFWAYRWDPESGVRNLESGVP